MTRHGRNATNAAVYSYYEKKKDTKSSGYGSQEVRLGKDSMKDFDSCALSLQPCRHPVCTPDGWLYDKEVILQYLVTRQQEYSAQCKAYEKWLKADADKKEGDVMESSAKSRANFERHEDRISSRMIAGVKRKRPSETPSQVDTKPVMPSFWLPSQTPDVSHGLSDGNTEDIKLGSVQTSLTSADNPRLLAEASKNEATLVKRPDKKAIVCCPMSKKYLRLKDLVEVKFCPVTSDGSSVNRDDCNERYKCPISGDFIRNSTSIFVIKQTGEVITQSAIDKILRPAGLRHPVTDQVLAESDFIRLHSGGTGFSSTNDQLKSKKYGHSIAVA